MVIELIDILTGFTLVFLLLMLVLPKKIHYSLSGVILIILGSIPILNLLKYSNFNLSEFPVLDFVVYFIIVVAGKDLFKAGVEEEKRNILKFPSMILGLFMITLTSIPKLYKLGVIPWNLPPYPAILDSILYIICGVFLIIGIFTLFKNK